MHFTYYNKKLKYLEFPNYPDFPQELKQEIFELIDIQNFESFDDLLISSTPEVVQMVKDLYGFEGKDSKLGYAGHMAREMFPTLVKYHFLEAPENVKNWIKQYLPIEPASINIQVMIGGTSIAPHIDEIRQHAINYLLDTGGDVELKFYELKDATDEKWIHPQMFIPYEKLEIKEVTKVPINVWHILPTNKIHSVENIDPSRKRIALTISII